MVIVLTKRIRIIFHDVTGRPPRYMGSVTCEVSTLPEEFSYWLRSACGGLLVFEDPPTIKPAIAGKNQRTEEVKGKGKKSRVSRRKALT